MSGDSVLYNKLAYLVIIKKRCPCQPLTAILNSILSHLKLYLDNPFHLEGVEMYSAEEKGKHEGLEITELKQNVKMKGLKCIVMMQKVKMKG